MRKSQRNAQGRVRIAKVGKLASAEGGPRGKSVGCPAWLSRDRGCPRQPASAGRVKLVAVSGSRRAREDALALAGVRTRVKQPGQNVRPGGEEFRGPYGPLGR